MSQGAGHLSSAADVCFVLEGVLVGSSREVFCGLNPCLGVATGWFFVVVLVAGDLSQDRL